VLTIPESTAAASAPASSAEPPVPPVVLLPLGPPPVLPVPAPLPVLPVAPPPLPLLLPVLLLLESPPWPPAPDVAPEGEPPHALTRTMVDKALRMRKEESRMSIPTCGGEISRAARPALSLID
jgi:hypothetical protein